MNTTKFNKIQSAGEFSSEIQSSRREFITNSAKVASLAMLASALPLMASNANSSAKSLSPKENGKDLKLSQIAQITDYRTLGSGEAAMRVSNLGFGCMGLNYHRSVKLDKKVAIALVREAIERGVTLFDTAEVYGPLSNETLMGEALKGYTDKVFVSTKFGFAFENGKIISGKPDSSPKNIRRAVEGSLKRLKIDSIPLLYQHRFDPQTPAEVVAQTIKELIKEGKVQRFGLCEVSAEIIEKTHKIVPLTAIQSEYHLMYRNVEREILPLCERLGIGFVPYSPINRGFLSGAISEWTKFDAGNDNRAELPRFTKEAIRANLAIVNVLDEFGRARGYTAAQIAQSWLLHKKPFIVPITGTSKLAHLEENLRATQIVLSNEDINELEKRVGAIKIIGERYPQKEQKQVR